MIAITGGVYLEVCMSPSWSEVYGSGGRAASAIARLGGDAELNCYADDERSEVIKARSELEGFALVNTAISKSTKFAYHHCLETPTIHFGDLKQKPIPVQAEHVIQFGFIEGGAIVTADFAVYDPQNPGSPEKFESNGSTARHLALILNKTEASILYEMPAASATEIAKKVISSGEAEVVIIKMGPLGALVCDETGHHHIPAYFTESVWKIGSGDVFVATFGYFWMERGIAPLEAATLASKATAYYCENMGFPSFAQLKEFKPEPIVASQQYLDGQNPQVYLAGPFFTMAQLWLIDEVRKNLREAGLIVFSPYHDIGMGAAEDVVHQDLKAIDDCNLLFAIGDGLDSGTMYEIGYARAKNKPVILYTENETAENKKMMEGSGCMLFTDYVTAIYNCVWEAMRL